MKKNFNDIEVNDMIVCKTLSGIEYVMTVTSISENKVSGTGRTPEETKYIKEILGGTYECLESDFVRFYHPHKMILPVSYLVNGFIDFDAETMADAMQQFESMRYSEILNEKINIEKDIDDKRINEKSLMIPVPAEGPAMYNPEYVNYLLEKANENFHYHGDIDLCLTARSITPDVKINSIRVVKKDGTERVFQSEKLDIDKEAFYAENGVVLIFINGDINDYGFITDINDVALVFVDVSSPGFKAEEFSYECRGDQTIYSDKIVVYSSM